LKLAGVNPLAFIHDNTAAALYNGIRRLDNETTHRVIFYNMGSSATTVSLVEYDAIANEKKMKRKYPMIE